MSQFSRILLAVAVGALVGAAYGGLVVVTHVLTTGRWDFSPVFAASSAGVGAALGLLGGILYSLATIRRSSDDDHANDHES
jgi:hypothetical protein